MRNEIGNDGHRLGSTLVHCVFWGHNRNLGVLEAIHMIYRDDVGIIWGHIGRMGKQWKSSHCVRGTASNAGISFQRGHCKVFCQGILL